MKCIPIILLTALAMTGVSAMAYEEPGYEVLDTNEDYEIRRYAPYIVAEVDVDGDFRSAGSEAFRLLAGYIFGKNRDATKMAMTTPVRSEPTRDGVKMNMTVPVASSRSAAGAERYTYAFVMERKYTLDTLPVPEDPRVNIRELPAQTVAVRRFSGRWSDTNFQANEIALIDALSSDGVSQTGTPVLARYNGPTTPWFLRRNEILVPVSWGE